METNSSQNAFVKNYRRMQAKNKNIRINLSLLSPNTWNYWPEKLRIRKIFTQCLQYQAYVEINLRANKKVLQKTYLKWSITISKLLGKLVHHQEISRQSVSPGYLFYKFEFSRWKNIFKIAPMLIGGDRVMITTPHSNVHRVNIGYLVVSV